MARCTLDIIMKHHHLAAQLQMLPNPVHRLSGLQCLQQPVDVVVIIATAGQIGQEKVIVFLAVLPAPDNIHTVVNLAAQLGIQQHELAGIVKGHVQLAAGNRTGRHQLLVQVALHQPHIHPTLRQGQFVVAHAVSKIGHEPTVRVAAVVITARCRIPGLALIHIKQILVGIEQRLVVGKGGGGQKDHPGEFRAAGDLLPQPALNLTALIGKIVPGRRLSLPQPGGLLITGHKLWVRQNLGDPGFYPAPQLSPLLVPQLCFILQVFGMVGGAAVGGNKGGALITILAGGHEMAFVVDDQVMVTGLQGLVLVEIGIGGDEQAWSAVLGVLERPDGKPQVGAGIDPVLQLGLLWHHQQNIGLAGGKETAGHAQAGVGVMGYNIVISYVKRRRVGDRNTLRWHPPNRLDRNNLATGWIFCVRPVTVSFSF